jgi:hypothetical protein
MYKRKKGLRIYEGGEKERKKKTTNIIGKR